MSLCKDVSSFDPLHFFHGRHLDGHYLSGRLAGSGG